MVGNPYRGEVDFPHFFGAKGCEFVEEGVHLRFRTGDLQQLRQKYGSTYKLVLTSALNDSDPEAILLCLQHGLKLKDGKAFKMGKDLADDLPFDLNTAAVLVFEALYWSWYGRSPADAAEEARKVVEATLDQGEAEGIVPPQMSSSGSSTPPLEPASSQTLSGD
jgi:hypothetical protein